MQWICQPRNPDSLHQIWFPPKVAAESRGQRDEGGEMDAGGKRPDSHPSLRVATSKHLVMNQLFTTRFSNLSGAWQPDDVPLDASTPDSGSVQSTSGLCVGNYTCVRGYPNCHQSVRGPGTGLAQERGVNQLELADPGSRSPDPAVIGETAFPPSCSGRSPVRSGAGRHVRCPCGAISHRSGADRCSTPARCAR
jgi:hypothetical protein